MSIIATRFYLYTWSLALLLSSFPLFLLPQALNLRLDPFPHRLQCTYILLHNSRYALEHAILNLFHLPGIVLHIRRHHILRLVVALHHGPAQTILELIDFLLFPV